MKMLWVVLALCAGVLLGGAPAVALAAEDQTEPKEETETIPLDKCPAKVQETLKKEAEGGELGEIVKQTEDGKTTYEAEIAKNDKAISVSVDAEGKLVLKQEEVDLAQCPAPVQATAKKEAEGGEVAGIAKETKGEAVTYLVGIFKGEKLIALIVDAEGKLLKKEIQEEPEEEITLDQCPAKVQETLKKEAEGGKIECIEKVTDGDKVVYEAEIAKDGKTIDITVDAEGKVLSKEVEKEDDDDKKPEEKKDEK